MRARMIAWATYNDATVGLIEDFPSRSPVGSAWEMIDKSFRYVRSLGQGKLVGSDEGWKRLGESYGRGMRTGHRRCWVASRDLASALGKGGVDEEVASKLGEWSLCCCTAKYTVNGALLQRDKSVSIGHTD